MRHKRTMLILKSVCIFIGMVSLLDISCSRSRGGSGDYQIKIYESSPSGDDLVDDSIKFVTPNIYTNGYAFAALREDGSVVTWGNPFRGGDSTKVEEQLDGKIKVKTIYHNPFSFAALREDGSVVTWGSNDNGGNSSSVSEKLTRVESISSTKASFAALRTSTKEIVILTDQGELISVKNTDSKRSTL